MFSVRFRYWFMGLGSALAVCSIFLFDPDAEILKGVPMASSVALLVSLMTPLLAVAFSHIARRGLFDYLDLKALADKASDNPVGAGLVFLGVCQVLGALLGLFGGSR